MDLGVPQAEAVPPEALKLTELVQGFADAHDGIEPTHNLAAFRL